jgi:DNA-binding response OmpR family regulator
MVFPGPLRSASLHDPPRILVVEDDDEMRRLVAEGLRKDGYDVVAVSDGSRLLESLAGSRVAGNDAGHWDLVVSDVRMPGHSGFRILEEMRAAKWHVPFILMTAFGDSTTHQQAHALGAILFDKPFDLTTLRTAVASLLRRP